MLRQADEVFHTCSTGSNASSDREPKEDMSHSRNSSLGHPVIVIPQTHANNIIIPAISLKSLLIPPNLNKTHQLQQSNSQIGFAEHSISRAQVAPSPQPDFGTRKALSPLNSLLRTSAIRQFEERITFPASSRYSKPREN